MTRSMEIVSVLFNKDGFNLGAVTGYGMPPREDTGNFLKERRIHMHRSPIPRFHLYAFDPFELFVFVDDSYRVRKGHALDTFGADVPYHISDPRWPLFPRTGARSNGGWSGTCSKPYFPRRCSSLPYSDRSSPALPPPRKPAVSARWARPSWPS